jgi:hypothetical protein
MSKSNEILCRIDHCVSMAKTSKYYAIRAKIQGTSRVAETYIQERKHWMRQARELSA